MTWIKICGTTNLDDALLAVDAGADAIGFVFYEKSPRNVAPEAAAEIAAKLPGSIEKIGVFVDGTSSEPWDVVKRAHLTGIQSCCSFDGAASGNSGAKAAGFAALRPYFKRSFISLPAELFLVDNHYVGHLAATLAKWRDSLTNAVAQEGILDTFMLDSSSVSQPGGTGKTFDWQKAVPVANAMQESGMKLIVAGGLGPENVVEAISLLQPWGVDVVSGVEATPGKKDPDKVRAFVKAVREKDRKAS